MGFGAILAGGERNVLLADELMGCLIEVRVEQFLDQPTRFALRFQEDLQDGEPRIAQATELQVEQMITIAVEVEDQLVCLVRGPITERRSSMTLGGPGSWYEVRGIDRRVEMSRQCRQKAWEGRASEAAAAIFSSYGFEPDVQETVRVFEESTGTLNQRATDHDFVKTLARQNNLAFWISCEAEVSISGKLTVEETAHFTSSPPRPDGAISSAIPSFPLLPDSAVVLRAHVTKEQCPNVMAFSLNVNAERPTSSVGFAVDDRTVAAQSTSGRDQQPPLVDGGRTLASIATAERSVCLVAAGNPEELQVRSEAALTEAGWFTTASASTTAYMLGGVVQPHEVIQVEGLGKADSGAYQVVAVTHVINAADHSLEIQLRRNAIGQAP